jgi:hypothetical protein
MLCDHINYYGPHFHLTHNKQDWAFYYIGVPINLFKPNFCAYELKDKVLSLLHLTQPKWAKKSIDGK